MNEHTPTPHTNRLCLMAAAGGTAAACVTGAACIGPLLGVALGVGGLGWLSRYSFLQLPATLASIALLLAGFVLLRRRAAHCPDGPGRRGARAALWSAALFAAAINGFEYLILPNLG